MENINDLIRIPVIEVEKVPNNETNTNVLQEQSNFNNQINLVVKVILTGGLIGLFAGDTLQTINKKTISANKQGWELIQIIPDTNVNLLTTILRVIILFSTLFIFTTANGYYLILKRR